MPKFCMLIGPSGSGKTTFANSCKGYEILSSDAIRRELYGDESIQTNPAKVFDIMNSRARDFLLSGKGVVYDATNLNKERRVRLLKSLPECEKIAMLFKLPVESLIKNDENRERHVGSKVIRRQLRQLQVPTYDEGWDSIYHGFEGNINILISE